MGVGVAVAVEQVGGRPRLGLQHRPQHRVDGCNPAARAKEVVRAAQGAARIEVEAPRTAA